MKTVGVFGSTGSVGENTLKICEHLAARFRVHTLAVGKNLEYVLETIRCEGTSEWRATPHDEFALVMDGTVVVELLDPDEQLVDPAAQGSIGLDGEPAGKRMGKVTAWRGHQVLLPAGRCYRFHCDAVGVILLQTIEGPDTVYKWAEICQTEA